MLEMELLSIHGLQLNLITLEAGFHHFKYRLHGLK